MMQNQHRLDETATPAAMLNNTGPNATKFKVVSPNGIMSPKQAHEKRGGMRWQKAQPLVNKGLRQYFE